MSLRWNDTRGDTVLATRAITEMICDGVATIFGPEGPCYVEAIVSQARNIPMISYVSFSVLFFRFYTMVSCFIRPKDLIERNILTMIYDDIYVLEMFGL